jgi:hypothetical protein
LGEDVGQPSTAANANSLVQIGESMQVSQVLVLRGLRNENTRTIQKQIVDDLATLISELEASQWGGRQQPGNQPGNQGGGPPGDQPGNRPGAGSQGGATGAADSNPSAATPNRTPPIGSPQDLAAVADRVWGHLPERERQQLIQNVPEEFLPKYERELRQYYERLAEEFSILQP